MKFYMNDNKFKHLKEECFVMVKSFYVEYKWTLVHDMENVDVIVQKKDDHFFVRIFTVEGRINIFDGDYRNSLKRQLYNMLSETSGRNLPWGILQGIRPTKLVYKLFRMMDIEDIREGSPVLVKTLMEDYLLSREMAVLAVEVACEEFQLIPSEPDGSIASIYISIPFCPTRCHYCSFPSNPLKGWMDKLDTYVDGLIYEMERVLPKIFEKYRLSTVYIGGGTPTTLSANQLDRLIKKLYDLVGNRRIIELTVEAGRPDTITVDKLKVLKVNGVDRISINPQTMNAETLHCIGRDHTVDEIYQGLVSARTIGINRINMDTIIGLPGEREEQVRKTFDELMKIRPSELTVHTLAIKRSSVIHERLEDYPLPDHEETKELLKSTRQVLRENGYKPYYLYRQKNMVGSFENVGYYLDKPCIYNMEIMEEVISIYGFGAGAITKVVDDQGTVKRIENVKNVKIYLERIEEMVDRKLNYLGERKTWSEKSK